MCARIFKQIGPLQIVLFKEMSTQLILDSVYISSTPMSFRIVFLQLAQLYRSLKQAINFHFQVSHRS